MDHPLQLWPKALTKYVCAGVGQLFSARNLKPLSVGLSLMLFQQITGQPSVLYYAGKIFEAAGFGEAKDATGISVFLGFFKLLMTGAQPLE